LAAVLSALSIAPFEAAASGYVIGNGGDGVFVKGRLVLRDLDESGVTEPYFGDLIDPDIEARMSALPIDPSTLPFSWQLLARKLTDLNRLSPDLGQFVLEAIRSYAWIALPASLALVPDPEYLLDASIPPVQIANRLDTTIRIASGAWRQLDDANRIALIIHEAVYSLLRPICERTSNTCFQSAHTARDLTGRFFRIWTYANDVAPLASQIRQQLGLPFGKMDHDRLMHRYWRLSLLSVDNPGWNSNLKVELPVSAQRAARRITSTCAQIRRQLRHSPGLHFEVRSTIDLAPFTTTFQFYRTKLHSTSGREKIGNQVRMIFNTLHVKHQDTLLYDFSTPGSSCEETLFQHYQIAIRPL
jgi:hypothetical protein